MSKLASEVVGFRLTGVGTTKSFSQMVTMQFVKNALWTGP